jgi:hypothetical protein
MMLTEQVNPIDRVEVLADGSLQIREATIILRDGVADSSFSPSYRRYVLHPGADLAAADARIAAVAGAVWTAEIVAAYSEVQAAQRSVSLATSG